MRPDLSRVRLSPASYFATLRPVPSRKMSPSKRPTILPSRFLRYPSFIRSLRLRPRNCEDLKVFGNFQHIAGFGVEPVRFGVVKNPVQIVIMGDHDLIGPFTVN